MTNQEFKIYVTGHLNGKVFEEWVTVDPDWMDDGDDLLNEMLSAIGWENVEDDFDYEIEERHNFEGDDRHFSQFTFDDYVKYTLLYKKYEEVFEAIWINDYYSLDDCEQQLEENYIGKFDKVEDFAYDFVQDTYNIPVQLQYYIDYEKLGKDLVAGGDIVVYEHNGDNYIFHG